MINEAERQAHSDWRKPIVKRQRETQVSTGLGRSRAWVQADLVMPESMSMERASLLFVVWRTTRANPGVGRYERVN